MGLGVSILGEIASRSPLKDPGDDAYRVLKNAIVRAVPDPLQHRMLKFEEVEDELAVTLHPAAEPIFMALEDEDTLSLTAKTSTVGPGYHAMLVEVIDRIASPLGVEWNWNDGVCGPGDDTGYAMHRDFGQLQRCMATFLSGLSANILEIDADAGIGLFVPMDYMLNTERYAYSPLGYWDRAWFERIADTSGAELLLHGREFFPWWNYATDGEYWLKSGLVLAWLELPWTTPENEQECDLYRLVLDCWARARIHDPLTALPEPALCEIRSILGQSAAPPPPDASGIGFRKLSMRRTLTGDWTVDVPGYFRESPADDGTAIAYHHGGRTVRGTSIVLGEHADQADLGVRMVRQAAEKHQRGHAAQHFTLDDIEGWGVEQRSEKGDYWCFNGYVGTGNHLCCLTLAYDNPDRDRDWAIQVFKSTRLTTYCESED